jgi:hypothetical protein
VAQNTEAYDIAIFAFASMRLKGHYSLKAKAEPTVSCTDLNLHPSFHEKLYFISLYK